MRPALGVLTGLPLLCLLLAGCGDEQRAPVDPGEAQDAFVGARADVTGEACERAGDGWRAAGRVTNPLDRPADYRIYVSYVEAGGQTLEVGQVDVVDVPPAGMSEWSDSAVLPAEEVRCVLRVERVEVR